MPEGDDPQNDGLKRPSSLSLRVATPVPPRRSSISPPGGSSPPRSVRPSRPPPSFRVPAINYELVNAARRVIEISLSVVPGERVLVLVDASRKDVVGVFEEVIRNVGATPIVMSLDDMQLRPVRRVPDALSEALEHVQACVIMTSLEEGESFMHAELCGLAPALGLRIALMAGLSSKSLLVGFAADSSWLIDATRAVRTRLRPESTLRFRSSAGADLDVRLGPDHRWVAQAGLIRGGRSESLPAGRLSTTASDINGVFVANASIGEWFGAQAGLLTLSPVRFEIEHSVCRAVRCADRSLQREVEAYLRREPASDRVTTVVLGTNAGLSAPVGEYLCDSTLPSVHLMFGDGGGEGGAGAIIPKPPLGAASAGGDIDLDSQPLLRSGRYIMS